MGSGKELVWKVEGLKVGSRTLEDFGSRASAEELRSCSAWSSLALLFNQVDRQLFYSPFLKVHVFLKKDGADMTTCFATASCGGQVPCNKVPTLEGR